MTGWLEAADVLALLGLDASGPNLDRLLPVAESTVQGWRMVDAPVDWSTVKATHPHVYEAGVQTAALLYQSGATPEGFAGFDPAGGIIGAEGAKWVQIRRMARALAPGVG